MTNPNNAGATTSRERGAMPFAARGRPATPDRSTARDHAAPDGAMVAVANYPDYLSAQRAVDHLSDNKFPVARVTIVGTDVRLVERVLGRLTVARAALIGAGTGAWLGLLIGVLLGVFAVGSWWQVVLFAVVAAAVWGALFGAIAHAMTGGRRDFASATAIQADSYSLMVDAEYADQARQLLGQLQQ
jgi:hypothetical protein